MRFPKPSKSDAALLFLVAAASFAMFKASDDPMPGWVAESKLARFLHQADTGNQVTFDLSVGFVSAIATYFLLVRLPEVQKRRRIVRHLDQTLKEVKTNLIRIFLSMTGSSYDAEVPERLLEPIAFREYFHAQHSHGQTRWQAISNQIDDYWLRQMLAELEVLQTELQFSLAAVGASQDNTYGLLKRVCAWAIRAKATQLGSDDLKSFLRSLWSLHTGFSFLDGYSGKDHVAAGIRSL